MRAMKVGEGLQMSCCGDAAVGGGVYSCLSVGRGGGSEDGEVGLTASDQPGRLLYSVRCVRVFVAFRPFQAIT